MKMLGEIITFKSENNKSIINSIKTWNDFKFNQKMHKRNKRQIKNVLLWACVCTHASAFRVCVFWNVSIRGLRSILFDQAMFNLLIENFLFRQNGHPWKCCVVLMNLDSVDFSQIFCSSMKIRRLCLRPFVSFVLYFA